MDPNHKPGEAKEKPAVDKRCTKNWLKYLYILLILSHILQIQCVIMLGKESYSGSEILSLETYTDANCAGSPLDGRLVFGYITFLGGNLITWKGKKQNETLGKARRRSNVYVLYSIWTASDVLTKGLKSSNFHDQITKLGMEDMLPSTLNHQATNDIMSYNSFNKITTHKFNKDLIV
ncbi:hypothetical protein CR513_16120, partial [Mucuna pruriens]